MPANVFRAWFQFEPPCRSWQEEFDPFASDHLSTIDVQSALQVAFSRHDDSLGHDSNQRHPVVKSPGREGPYSLIASYPADKKHELPYQPGDRRLLSNRSRFRLTVPPTIDTVVYVVTNPLILLATRTVARAGVSNQRQMKWGFSLKIVRLERRVLMYQQVRNKSRSTRGRPVRHFCNARQPTRGSTRK